MARYEAKHVWHTNLEQLEEHLKQAELEGWSRAIRLDWWVAGVGCFVTRYIGERNVTTFTVWVKKSGKGESKEVTVVATNKEKARELASAGFFEPRPEQREFQGWDVIHVQETNSAGRKR